MRVLQVSTLDRHGGAERIAWDLYQGLGATGHTSYLAVGRKKSREPHVLEIPNDAVRNPWARSWRAAGSPITRRHLPGSRLLLGLANLSEPGRCWNQWRGVEDFDFPGTRHLLDLPPQRPDILHAHNLHGGYFDLRLLPWLSQQLPVVLTLHDAWLLSGHCSHSLGCERWRTGCGYCPDLSIYPAVRRDATANNWRRKQTLYARSRLYIAAPCQWLMDKVMDSMLRPAVIEARVIPNGVDLSIFRAGNKLAARQALGLPQDAWIALFVGNKAQTNQFKDYATLEAAIGQVGNTTSKQKLIFLCLGQNGEDKRVGSASIRFVDYQRDVTRVAQFYQAADVYLHGAHADTFPNVVLEALACGTPVVATSVGGIPEQIEEGRTGFLVPPRDSETMAKRIEQLRDDNDMRCRMSMEASTTSRRRFSLQRMVSDYIDWYHEILQDRGAL